MTVNDQFSEPSMKGSNQNQIIKGAKRRRPARQGQMKRTSNTSFGQQPSLTSHIYDNSTWWGRPEGKQKTQALFDRLRMEGQRWQTRRAER
jgi:hypothetical protein